MQRAPKSFRLHIGLFGRRNVGKSSLLNGITRQQVSIVSDHAGTTTDPVYKSMEVVGDRIIVHFDSVGSGLCSKGENTLAAFAIAGPDRRFVKATARIVDNTVQVSAPGVTMPVAVRYAWAANPEDCNLQNKEGFPASPFRTDDWPPSEGTPENQWRNQ